MTKITINHKSHTIEMSKSAYKAATRFGSEAYEEVQKARAAYPTYKVVEKSVSSKKTSEYKGLTYGYMEAYIAKHDDEEKTIMASFNMLRGIGEDAEAACAVSRSYREIKEWFLATYPDIVKFHEKREQLLAKCGNAAA